MLRTANNETIRRAVMAVARAQAQIPTFELSRALEAALRVERAISDEKAMHVTFALCALLLKGMGVEPGEMVAMTRRH